MQPEGQVQQELDEHRQAASGYQRPAEDIQVPPAQIPQQRHHRSVIRTPMVPVTGRAKVRNQCPPVAKLIYSRYSPMATKSAGTKITGWAF